MDDIEQALAQMIRDGELILTATGDWAFWMPLNGLSWPLTA